MDLKTGWDFIKEEDIARALKVIRRDRRCSTLQKMDEAKWRGNAVKENRRRTIWKEAVRRAEFCIELYRWRMGEGFYMSIH